MKRNSRNWIIFSRKTLNPNPVSFIPGTATQENLILPPDFRAFDLGPQLKFSAMEDI